MRGPRHGLSAPRYIHACSFLWVSPQCSCPGKDGQLRLVGGDSGPGFEYGRLEVFLRGFWSSICNVGGFSSGSAAVACSALGYAAAASLTFPQAFNPPTENQVSVLSNLILIFFGHHSIHLPPFLKILPSFLPSFNSLATCRTFVSSLNSGKLSCSSWGWPLE